MSVQNIVFLYDSIVHPYYKGSSGEYEVTNSIGIIIYYIVPMCNADTCTYTVYTHCDSVYAMYVHTMYMEGKNKVVSAGLGDSVGDSVGDPVGDVSEWLQTLMKHVQTCIYNVQPKFCSVYT
jgi:hypothetical protein